MDRKKLFIFLILFEFIIISLFSYNSKVFAADYSAFGIEQDIPSVSEVYDSLPDTIGSFSKSDYSKDQYFCFYLTNIGGTSDPYYYYVFAPSYFKDDENYFAFSYNGVLDLANSDTCYLYFLLVSGVSSSGSLGYYDSAEVVRDYRAFARSSQELHLCFSTSKIQDKTSGTTNYFLPIFPQKTLGQVLLDNKNLVLAQVVHLLPIALLVLVSWIGLRKALIMLFHFLRKS